MKKINQTLDKKLRPEEFEDVLGNEKEINSFVVNLEKENGPHCFVITGPSGCGKTTLARIAAKHVGATDLSITELNTGNNRGIETSRDLISKMRYSMGGTKVFIMDEAHKMTKDGKAALLKPTEDVPDHVYFFFLTTDPTTLFKGDEGKALKTRLTPVKVTGIKPSELYKYLRRVVKKEDLNIEPDTLKIISEKCGGSPRQALVYLEAIKDLEDPDDQIDKLESMTVSDDPEVIEFCRTLLPKNTSWKTLGNMLLSFKDKKDAEEVRRIVMGYMQSVLIKSGSPRAAYILECFCDYQYSNGFPGITLATYQAFQGE